ncbi:hypothetical protein F6Q07_03505 [Pectobacterium parmentieri]|uniref:class I SAM-dependent methyltransferase n=1 Tax=Pectobacterium parmentieri TaxID=1905730 RepID=UPI0013C53455|nr:class I SAM-dependent methyltransferase [Pectobacterium parmentieri]MBI0517205.1 hypothetical protein [Pectobacterium parmentieri]
MEDSVYCQGIMESRGIYNQHAKVQASGNFFAMPILDGIVDDMSVFIEGKYISIADYGSSQGKNSLLPIGKIIHSIRSRFPSHPIFVMHTDQINNDYSTLFNVLENDSESYTSHKDVFYCAIGRSFYSSILPSNSILLGWSAYAAMWLSYVSINQWDHIVPYKTSSNIQRQLAQQGEQDWRRFLAARATELQVGGKLVLLLAGIDNENRSGFDVIIDNAAQVLDEMVIDGYFSSDERAVMKIATYMRRSEEVLAPFTHQISYCGLRVVHFSVDVLSDPAWQHYLAHNDVKEMAAQQVSFFRSTFMPSLLSALEITYSAIALQNITRIFEEKLTERCASCPVPMEQRAQILVLEKIES